MLLMLRYWMNAGRISRELWWTNQEISPVDMIPPWLFVLMYHLEDVQ
jgi:hypothetical protein